MKMKISKLLLCGAVFALASCNLEYLPETEYPEYSYYSTDAEVESCLITAYAKLRDVYDYQYKYTELRSDNSYPLMGGLLASSADTNLENLSFSLFTVDYLDDNIPDYFEDLYITINRCNTTMESLENVNDDDLRDQIEAEALFIRGLMYFELIRAWGDVWYVDSSISGPEALEIEKSSFDTILASIISDLETVVNGGALPTQEGQASADIGRATQEAARTLLAKMYITQSHSTEAYNKAITVLEPVITTKGLTGMVSYADIFSITNEMNSEILFAARYTTGNVNAGSRFANDYRDNSDDEKGTGTGDALNAPREGLLALYGIICAPANNDKGTTASYKDEDDYMFNWIWNSSSSRLCWEGIQVDVDCFDLVLSDDYDDPDKYADNYAEDNGKYEGTGDITFLPANSSYEWDERIPVNFKYGFGRVNFFNNKFKHAACTIDNDAENDFPLIRYADAVLMMAEAQNAVYGVAAAATYVDAIRKRAGLKVMVDTSISADEMHEVILTERRKEFAFENQRWYDLMREGTEYTIKKVRESYANDQIWHAVQSSWPQYIPDQTDAFINESRLYLPVPFEVSSLY